MYYYPFFGGTQAGGRSHVKQVKLRAPPPKDAALGGVRRARPLNQLVLMDGYKIGRASCKGRV